MPQGLTTGSAEAYIVAHGYNEIVERKQSLLTKLAKRAVSPISLMLLLAADLSYWSGKDFDAGFILALLVVNIGVTILQERKADTAIEKLNEHLATTVKTMRDGAWKKLPSRLLVPHDVIELRSGDVVPADALVREANRASANEAALTGESLPKEKGQGDTLYSGSFVASGIITAEVSATGSGTYFGSTVAKVDAREKRSSLEREMLRISQFLSVLAMLAVLLLSVILYAAHAPFVEIVRLDLSLVIAGIPIDLPTVMTLIIAFGVVALARKGAIVRRLASLEELANTDYLLTDKTGTLTENKIAIQNVIVYAQAAENDVMRLAGIVAQHEADFALDKAILERAGAIPQSLSFIPSDSTRKRATASYEESGRIVTLSLGAPQVIAGLCALSPEAKARFDVDVSNLAEGGYRALALARAGGEREEGMELVAVFALSDTLRADAGDVVRFLEENGVGVTMNTGDNRAIAREIAEKLNVRGSRIITSQDKPAQGWSGLAKDDFRDARSFAEILPEDKYELVRSAERFYTVAVNGDGVNDMPAVKAADVGFAVKEAVDALKGAADIVLLTDGIAVMRDAFIEGRKIFMRLYTYSVYRISESFRLIVTIAFLGFFSGTYPLSPLQLILIAILNDLPIISLAGNRVKVANRPARLNVIRQFGSSTLFGLVGVVNSLLLYFLALNFLRLPLSVVQTLFFLKLTISGHMLIYVAHTEERWWRYLPSSAVIIATSATQAIATLFAITGWLMPAPISWPLAVFVWAWAFFFMQITEATKLARERLSAPSTPTTQPATV